MYLQLPDCQSDVRPSLREHVCSCVRSGSADSLPSTLQHVLQLTLLGLQKWIRGPEVLRLPCC